MPFTLAHPAIILPLNKTKRFSITALIVGSMVPDFEFFFQMREVENIGHHWYGILLFDFPVALISCFLFHNLLRNAVIVHLPESISNRVSDVLDFDWNSYARLNSMRVSLSIFVGIASHLLWDGLTHYDGLFVELFPLLSAKINFSIGAIPVYFLLQLVFSVMGLLTVGYVILCLPQQPTNISRERNKWYWPLFVLFFTLILYIRLAGWPQYNSFWGVFMAVMGSFCYSWVSISVVIKNYYTKKIPL